jgi:hypothetical protein
MKTHCRYFIHSFIFFLFFAITANIFADERTEPIDFTIVVDKSSSMEEEIESVKEYIKSDLIEALIPGDFFRIILFYGEAQEVYASELTLSSINQLPEIIDGLEADGRFTDIANALDLLSEKIPEDPGRRKYLLLLTDGRQEAPPESPYYTEDGSYNHRFMENVRTTRMKGWFIHLLGIGDESAAQEIADQLGARYSQVGSSEDGSTPSASDIETALGDILGSYELFSEPLLRRTGKNSAVLVLEVQSLYEQANTLEIEKISDTESNRSYFTGKLPFNFTQREEIQSIEIPLENIPEDLEGLNLSLSFGINGGFSPSDIQAELPPFRDFTLLIILLIAVPLLALLIWGILQMTKGKGIMLSIKATIQDGGTSNKHFDLQNGDSFYVVKAATGFILSAQKRGNLMARFYNREGNLLMDVLDAKQFLLKAKGSVLGKTLDIPKPDGSKARISIAKE